MSREKTFAKNVFVIALGVFLPKLTNIILLPVITAGLTKAEYGTYDLISILVSLLLPIATLQIQSSVFRFLIDSRDNRIEAKCIVTNAVVFGTTLSSLSFSILFFVLHRLELGIRLLICLYFFTDALLSIARQIVRGFSNNKLYSLASTLQALVNTLFAVITVSFWKQGLKGALLSMFAASLFSLLLLFLKGNIIENIDFSSISLKTLKKMLHYSWPMIPNQLSSWILSASDRMILTTFMGLEATAVYAAAYKIPSLLTALQSTFTFAWQESASLASKDNDREKYYSDMFDTMFCIMAGLLGLLIAATPVLFRILIRGDYKDSYPQMPILFLGMLFSSLSSYMGGIYIAFKKTASVGLTTAFAAALNLLIDFALVNKIGIYAASLSTLLSYFVWLLYRMIDVQKFQRVHFRFKKILFQLILLLIMCVFCWLNNLYTNILNFIIACTSMIFFNRKIIRAILIGVRKRIK